MHWESLGHHTSLSSSYIFWSDSVSCASLLSEKCHDHLSDMIVSQIKSLVSSTLQTSPPIYWCAGLSTALLNGRVVISRRNQRTHWHITVLVLWHLKYWNLVLYFFSFFYYDERNASTLLLTCYLMFLQP